MLDRVRLFDGLITESTTADLERRAAPGVSWRARSDHKSDREVEE
jgi:hypothetical protein